AEGGPHRRGRVSRASGESHRRARPPCGRASVRDLPLEPGARTGKLNAVHRFLGGFFAVAALFGCTTTQYRLDGGVGSDAGGPMGVLTLESASSFALRFGEQVDIEVRYTELGAPVPGVPIRFAL